MSLKNKQIHTKLSQITSDLLREKGYICPIDVFIKMEYLSQKEYEDWRFRRIPYLEKAIKINLKKINLIMKTVRNNCINGNLKPSKTGYKSWGKGAKQFLRFTKSGDANIEEAYSTRFVKRDTKFEISD